MIRIHLKEAINNIQNLDVIIKWLDGLTEGSKLTYLKPLAEFTIVTDKSPQELLDIAFEEEEARTPPWERDINNWFAAYENHCIENNRSKATRNGRTGIIRSFFHYYNLSTPKAFNRRKKKDKLKIKNKRPALTKDDIKKALDAARTLRIKAIMLTQASSGLSVSDVVKLRIKDFNDGLLEISSGKEICKLHLTREKTDKEFTTFLSYEAVHAIKNYIESERQFDGNPFLFQKLYLNNKNSNPQINEDIILREYRTLNERLNNEQKESGAFRPITSHMMRKFFNTQLTHSGMAYEPRKHMMGHKIPNMVDDSYYLDNQGELKELYIKFMGQITINPTKTLTVETDEYRKLRNQLDENKKEFEIKDGKIDKLEKKQEVLERMVKELMEKQLD